MGAINYKTSKFVTVGYNTNTINYDNEYYFYNIEDDFDNIKILLDKEYFNIFNVELFSGYYEGFTINIDFDYLYFDDYTEKQNALKELTKIKKLLIYCINNFNVSVCYPGWCTGFLDYKESLRAINDNIKKAKQYIKSIPTYKNYNFSYNNI